MMQSLRIPYLFYFIFIAFQANAQEGTLHFMNALPQVVYNNPAFVPRHRFSLGFPGSSVYALYSNNGFSYNNVISRIKKDTVTADLPKLYNALKSKNYIGTVAQVDLFRLSMRVSARAYFTYNLTVKSYTRVMLPKDVMGVFINGTVPFINKTAQLSPEIESLNYLESAWGLSYAVNKDLTLGLRFKLLKGIANITTEKATINLSLDNYYSITAAANVDLRSSGVFGATQPGFDPLKNWKDYLSNTGYGVDIGATYRVADRITFGLSLNDIGRIKWKNDVYGYSLDKNKSSYTFHGLDLNRMLNGNTTYMQAQMDTISKRFKLVEGKLKPYTSPLPQRLYFSANYEIKRNLTFGTLFFMERFRGRMAPAFSTSLNKNFGRKISASISYTITNHSSNNFGAGFSCKIFPSIQFYLVGDNLLQAPYLLAKKKPLNGYLNSMQYFNLRTGVNFVFGWYKHQERQPFKKKG